MKKKSQKLIWLLILLLLSCQSSFAETISLTNFESNTRSGWTDRDEDNGTIGTDSAVAHSGTYSLKANITSSGGDAILIEDIGDVIDTFYIRFYLYLTSAYVANIDVNNDEYANVFWSYSDGWEEAAFAVQLRQEGGIDLITLYYNNWHTRLESPLPSSDTWHCIEIYVYRHATEGDIEWWIDGVSQDVVTDTDIGDYDIYRFQVGLHTTGDIQGAIYIDDIVIDTSNYIGTGWRIQEGVAIGSLPYF